MLLFPLLGLSENITTYHFWLKYKEPPLLSCPIAVPGAMTALVGESKTYGYSPLASLVGAVNTDPLFILRIRNAVREELNPVEISSGAGFFWWPYGLESEYAVSEGRKIRMHSVPAGDETFGLNIKFLNESKALWHQDLVIYMKGESLQVDEDKAKKYFTVFSREAGKASVVKFGVEKTALESFNFSKEEDRQRLIIKLIIPSVPEKDAFNFNVSAGAGNEDPELLEAVNRLLSVNIYDLIEERKNTINRLLMKIPLVKNSVVETRDYYQGALLVYNALGQEQDIVKYNYRFYDEDKLKGLIVKQPWIAWRLYEVYGDRDALRAFFDLAIASGVMEPENVFDLYNIRCLTWMAGVLGRDKPKYSTKSIKYTELKGEEKLLFLVLEKFVKQDAEKELKEILNNSSFRYPEVYFIIDTLLKYGERDLAGRLLMSVKPYYQRYRERSFTEIACSNELFHITCGLGFSRGNLLVQPLDNYYDLWERDITGFKYRGNTVNFTHKSHGKYVEKVLVNGVNVFSKIIDVPAAKTPGTVFNIEAYYSDKPALPVLMGIKTNNWYFVRKAGYDEKSGNFNVDLQAEALENLIMTLNISKNGKKINRVTLNGKELDKYPNIKVNIK